MEIITCNPECKGQKDMCLVDIQNIVENGGVAFMLYSHHIQEKVEILGYKIEKVIQNNIPVAMRIRKENVQ